MSVTGYLKLILAAKSVEFKALKLKVISNELSKGLLLEANVISVKEWMKTVSVAERVNGAGVTKEGTLKLKVLEDPAGMV